ncbi:MAG: hypothetical protein M1821_003519 [Bathelium mastoideum]|nr:MAG: hypothetical protein M1821_003519 [Bathelium mastoideum]
MSDHDADGDSHMASSPELDVETTDLDDDMFPESSLDAPAPSTPRQSSSHLPPVSELSPPSSQSRQASSSTNTTSNALAQSALGIASDSAMGTALTNGVGPLANTRSGGASAGTGEIKVHEGTGYQWIRVEDEPGYAWRNRKAQEEAMKALEQIVDKEKMIGSRYPDLLLEQQNAEEKA